MTTCCLNSANTHMQTSLNDNQCATQETSKLDVFLWKDLTVECCHSKVFAIPCGVKNSKLFVSSSSQFKINVLEKNYCCCWILVRYDFGGFIDVLISVQ